MKKIGIITYHHYYNYGTMLQALALQMKVEELGYKSEIIDFKQDNVLSNLDLIKLRFKRIGIYIKNFKKYYILESTRNKRSERNKKFEEFYKQYIKVSGHSYSSSEELEQNPPEYDGYIVGSDQTWNPNVGKSPDAFYLSFVKSRSKCGSYAPSVGLASLSPEQSKRMKQKLDHINYLSCREQLGSELLQKLTERKVITALDPTLLIESEKWRLLENKEDAGLQKYILQYFLGDVPECRQFVRELSKRTKLPIVILPHSYLEVKNKDSIYCGPDGFLRLIDNAEYVCTDSFHGMAFSINFHKNFFAFHKRKENETDSDNSRITDLLKRLDIEERLIKDYKVPKDLAVDYQKIEKKLYELKSDSLNYLKNMLEEMVNND